MTPKQLEAKSLPSSGLNGVVFELSDIKGFISIYYLYLFLSQAFIIDRGSQFREEPYLSYFLVKIPFG